MAIGSKHVCNLRGLYNSLCLGIFSKSRDIFERHADKLLLLFGVFLLYSGSTQLAHAGFGSFGMACNGILSLVEGAFGALVTAVAGIGAIVASAMGGFKMAWTLIVVSVGSFVLRSYITLFNGDCIL